MTNAAQIDYIDKSIDGVLGTRTRGVRMVGADIPLSYGGHTVRHKINQLRFIYTTAKTLQLHVRLAGFIKHQNNFFRD